MTKTALITGGSSGLGFSLAQILGNEGYQIIILARNKQRSDYAVNELLNKKIMARSFECDVTKENELRKVADELKAENIKIDFLILNAGEVSTKLVSEYESIPELKKDLEIDLWGTIQATYFFLPFLSEGSKILMTSSGFGLMGAAGYSIYCAAKAGIINFGESLRRELLHKNINVYVTCPGDMDTPQFQNEIKGQPQWMKQGSPRKVIAVDVVLKKILKKCKGKMNFLIIPSSDVKLLSLVSKLLPRTWRDKLLDNMFPRPNK